MNVHVPNRTDVLDLARVREHRQTALDRIQALTSKINDAQGEVQRMDLLLEWAEEFMAQEDQPFPPEESPPAETRWKTDGAASGDNTAHNQPETAQESPRKAAEAVGESPATQVEATIAPAEVEVEGQPSLISTTTDRTISENVIGLTAGVTGGDAVQRNIKINHLALVDRARAGSQARIGDGVEKWGIAPTQDATPEKEPLMTLKTVTVDGIPIEVTDQGATVIATLQQRIADAAKKAAETDTAHVATVSAKDKEIATKDAEFDALKAKVVDGAALDKLVADRAALCAVAAKIAPTVKLDGLADADSCDWPVGHYTVRLTFLMTDPASQIAKTLLVETDDLEVIAVGG